MHIEPHVVTGAKLLLSYGSALTVFAYAAKQSWDHIKQQGVASLLMKSLITILLAFSFFEILPHQSVGVSEVHFILGSTLFLLFGLAPAAIGLASGLLIQGIFLAPFDLPQLGMNLTTLLVPLFAMAWVAKKIIPAGMAYKDVSYAQAVKLSAMYQGGIIVWVAFWAVYGQGFAAENLISVALFCAAYSSVILIEPLIDLGLLAAAKSIHGLQKTGLFESRLYNSAV